MNQYTPESSDQSAVPQKSEHDETAALPLDNVQSVSLQQLDTQQGTIAVREFTLKPKQAESSTSSSDRWLFIDREQFELKPVTCRLLPDKLKFFVSRTLSVPLDQATGRLVHQ